MLYRQSLICYTKKMALQKQPFAIEQTGSTSTDGLNATMGPYNHWLTDLTVHTVIQISTRRKK